MEIKDPSLMSIHTYRDARCNGTLAIPDPRIANSILHYGQVQYASVLQFLYWNCPHDSDSACHYG